jgi:integrase
VARRVPTIHRPKNGEVRHIPLNGPAIAALGELLKRSDAMQRAGPWQARVTGFEPAERKAKIRSFSWHCLRHTFAGRLVMAGVDPRPAQELMGHKSIQMTARYSHLTPKHALAFVELLTGAGSVTSTDTQTSTGRMSRFQLKRRIFTNSF